VQVDDHLEKFTREERQGLVVEGIPDADLFYVDKVSRKLLGVGFLFDCKILIASPPLENSF
jgi:hypothetical protein